jgi:hypothetical protein
LRAPARNICHARRCHVPGSRRPWNTASTTTELPRTRK